MIPAATLQALLFNIVIGIFLLAAFGSMIWAWTARRRMYRATTVAAIYAARTDRATARDLTIIFVGFAIGIAVIEELIH
jgi:hypothetical protein